MRLCLWVRAASSPTHWTGPRPEVPESVGLDAAVACMTQGLTAHYLVHDAHAQLVQPGEWMLMHSVAGGTCQLAAQMAKLRGYKAPAAGFASSLNLAPVGHYLAHPLCDSLYLLGEFSVASHP